MKKKHDMQAFIEESYLSASNAEYVELMYEQYLQDPSSVDSELHALFASYQPNQRVDDVSHKQIRDDFKRMARQYPCQESQSVSSKQANVNALIDSYRRVGYRYAAVNPLVDKETITDARLTLSGHGLSESDLNDTFLTNGLLPNQSATLSEIQARLKSIYLGSTGFDTGHVLDPVESNWLAEQIETVMPGRTEPKAERRQALKKLVQADTLERYLEKKYVAQKRFSLEGCDALVPMMDQLINLSASSGMGEIVIGMSHRGRVNVLLNNMGLCPSVLYEDFVGPKDYGDTSGDLKYHRGFSNDVSASNKTIHLSLLFNPSHLEYIAPVVMGSVRARQHKQPTGTYFNYAMGVVVHGDAAFSGEGIVMEALNMSQLRAHTVGGVVHIITNNQIGFTTSDTRDSRSAFACTDIAKLIDAPVFHVNADDLDAVQSVTRLAFEYRQRFNKDVVIDLFGYRRHGHQEADEPSATAPLLYQVIRSHPRSVSLYADKLIKEGIVSADDVTMWEKTQRDQLDAAQPIIPSVPNSLRDKNASHWEPFLNKYWRETVDTSVSDDKLKSLASRLYTIPDGFNLQRQVGMMVKSRQEMASGNRPMDWGFGEMMAYATLLDEGHSVRLVGQDSRRGTFSHRHSSLFDQKTGEELKLLNQVAPTPENIEIYDSPLNEGGALAFEYGHTVAEPNKLAMWEAQFGDFYNPAQVVVDQFISSGWQKWRRLSGLVMLLPHGCEGQGPEHTSARVERFLQLCAQQNIQIFVPSTPAQMFHLIRRQHLRTYRRPLVVMTPKSFLRNKLAVSSMDELSDGQLQMVIPEIDALTTSNVTRVVLCCGKVYFDLLAERRKREMDNIALIRIEQLYPFPYEELQQELKKYEHVKQVVWCQEEPKNQGAWFVTRHRLQNCLQPGQQLAYAGREPFAAPSSGFLGLHQQQQMELVNQALTDSDALFSGEAISENE